MSINSDDYDLETAWQRRGFQIVGDELPHHPSPERRARVYGYSAQEVATVGRWLELLLDEAPTARDSLDFWRACHVLRYIANPIETQAELAAKIGVTQQYVSKLVVKISEKLSEISAF